MQYREFGKTGLKVSALGFGVMRMPRIIPDDPSKIDIKKSTRMIHYAIDNGLNYIDTAQGYHCQQSEVLLGKALKKGYRQKIYIATKLSFIHKVKKKKDLDTFLNLQMKKLNTDYIDFYLFHALNRKRWKMINNVNGLEWADKQIKKGTIRHIGFSFHDNVKVFKRIVNAYNWPLCQIQYNYVDTHFQAGMEGLKYAAKKGMAVVVMEPLKGGSLARPPEKIKKVISDSKIKRTPPELGLLWVWNQPEVSIVLSGMRTMKDVKENIKTASVSGIGRLSEQELEIIKKIKATYQKLSPINCTQCGYCLPCPHGINIPYNFQLFNNAHLYFLMQPKNMYNNMPDKEKAVSCKKCRNCEELCPQKLPVRKLLKKVHNYLKKE